MKSTFIDCAQRSPEWYAARVGRLTGSRAADMLATLKSGLPAAAQTKYFDELVTERLTGLPDDDDRYVSVHMQRGTDMEAAAFDRYEALTGQALFQSGFLSCDDIMAGASLDGHIVAHGEIVGIVEIKCLSKRHHLQILRHNVIPEEYLAQLVHNLWVSGAEWVDFMSFDDRFPANMQTFVRRLERDEVDIAAYELKALAFLQRVAADVRDVTGLWA